MKTTYHSYGKKDSHQMLSNFHRDGFLFLPGFLTPTDLNVTQCELNRLIQDKITTIPSEDVYYEDKTDSRTLKQIQHLFRFAPYFHRMLFDSPFQKLASTLLGENAIGQNLQYFDKPAGIGQATPAHQDAYYFMLDSHQALTIWLALQSVDENNGCMRYIKGSHQQGLRPHHKTDVLGFSQGIKDFAINRDLKDEVCIPAEAGDMLVHHALTIHRADKNASSHRNRPALGLIYYAESARQNRKAHAIYAASLKKELSEKGRI